MTQEKAKKLAQEEMDNAGWRWLYTKWIRCIEKDGKITTESMSDEEYRNIIIERTKFYLLKN